MNEGSAVSDPYLKWIVAFLKISRHMVLGRLAISCRVSAVPQVGPLASISKSTPLSLCLSFRSLCKRQSDGSCWQDWDGGPRMASVPASGLSFCLICPQNRGLLFSTSSSIWEAHLLKGPEAPSKDRSVGSPLCPFQLLWGMEVRRSWLPCSKLRKHLVCKPYF